MTEKRFTIRKSMYIADGYVVVDNEHRHTFSTLPKSKAINYCRILNLLNDENKELKEEIIEWKSKYFEAMDTVINEYSTNIKEDMEELEKEVWGDVE